MTPPTTTQQALSARSYVRFALVVGAISQLILALLLVYAVTTGVDAVQAIKSNAARSDCRGAVSTDTYQAYWLDVSQALDGLVNNDDTAVRTATNAMKQIPLIKREQALRCGPPAAGGVTTTSGDFVLPTVPTPKR